jgi:hypothetical protein
VIAPGYRDPMPIYTTLNDDTTSPAAEVLARATARVRAEYLEMPGLQLTTAQAARLWQSDDLFRTRARAFALR